ncbi:MAG: hypothetical protein EON58_21675 [Alphaproteobacteria bacterium]|nr:MAG: hypothetical protein EON58_21675 [Alphaproteobacteria bacterium]
MILPSFLSLLLLLFSQFVHRSRHTLTHHRSRAPSPDACAWEQVSLIQCALPATDSAPRMSGTECLNLNITVPNLPAQEGRKLPVLVWIHGGGFVMGANYWPHYDPVKLVELSVDAGTSVVVVSIK